MNDRKLASNMTERIDGGASILISYETPVAIMTDEGPVAGEERYSQTTQRHISKWLRMHGSPLTCTDIPRLSDEQFDALCKHHTA